MHKWASREDEGGHGENALRSNTRENYKPCLHDAWRRAVCASAAGETGRRIASTRHAKLIPSSIRLQIPLVLFRSSAGGRAGRGFGEWA